jgi:putative MATE family efflux protein
VAIHHIKGAGNHMNDRQNMLGKEPINKLLIKLSLPATVGMMVNALYNVFDTIFIGKGVGAMGIAGLTVSFPIQMVIMALALMIGIGAASLISIRLGENKKEEADNIAGNSYVAIIVLSSIFTALGLIFLEPLLTLFGATPEILPYAKDYMSVIFIGTIFFSFVVSSNNLIRAEGNAMVSMIAMLIGTGMNIILDPIFIFDVIPILNINGFGLGIKGAALATILSQFMSFIFIIRYFYSGKSMLAVKPHHMKPKKEVMKGIFTVGLPAFGRQIGSSLIAIILNNLLVFYGGALALTVYGVINRVTMFLFMPMFGVVQGMQPIAGFNYGAKNVARVKEVIKKSIISLLVFSTFGWSLVQFFPEQLIKIFINDPEVIAMGSPAIKIVLFAVPIVGLQIISSSAFQAFGKALPALILSLLRQIILFAPLVLILPKINNLGLLGIWLAFPIADLISTVASYYLLLREERHLENMITDAA